MKLFPVLSALAMAVPAAGGASGMYGPGSGVHNVDDAVGEAVSDGLPGGAAFWCVAGSFVGIKLRAGPGTGIRVVRGAGIAPAGPSGDLNTLVVGDHKTAATARNFCSG
jgi:hypothetical protein